jgi:bisphosphoglycerate-independent phosphoglycerate mutase (AlkP superfamily)
MDYLQRHAPHALFVGYGETDEWAHMGRYDHYLTAAHQVDAFIAELWNTMQSMPEYRGSTTFIITTDHGRGSGLDAWRDHGQDVEGAENIWIAVLGPDTPALGERTRTATVTQSQIAATLAALLGEDYHATVPQSAAPLADVVRSR